MKTISKLKEKKQKKILIKEIAKDFEELVQKPDELEEIKSFGRKSIKIIQSARNRKKIFKNLTEELTILKAEKLPLKDVKTL